jgi:hypothetical protein
MVWRGGEAAGASPRPGGKRAMGGAGGEGEWGRGRDEQAGRRA